MKLYHGLIDVDAKTLGYDHNVGNEHVKVTAAVSALTVLGETYLKS